MRLGAHVLAITCAVLCTVSRNPANADDMSANQVKGELGHRLDDFLTRAAAFGFSGAVMVEQRGEVILHAGYGLARRGSRMPFAPDTSFDMGSVAKQLTATAVLLLEQRGRLSTNDPISRYLPNVPSDKADITLQQLLTHTSGLRRDHGDRGAVVTRREKVARLLATQLKSAPGAEHTYSNVGYVLLAAIVEHVSGAPFTEFMHTNLFDPAGMANTGFYEETSVWDTNKTAHGYYETWEESRLPEYLFTWNALGNGHIITTVGDMLLWDRALFRDGIILGAETLARLTHPYVPGAGGEFAYGYGWYVGKTSRNTRLVFHDGDSGNHSTVYRRYLDSGITLILTTNEGYITSLGQARTIAQSVDHILFGEEETFPPEVIGLRADIKTRFLGRYELETAGGQVQVSERNGHLMVQLRGQDAFDLFFLSDPETAPDLDSFLARTAALLEARKTQNIAHLSLVVGADRVNEFAWSIEGGWTDLESQFGPLESHTILGHGPWPFTKRWTRTNVELKLQQARVLVTIGYRGDELFDVSTWEETPSPAALWVAPVSETELASWNLWFKQGVRLVKTPSGLQVTAGSKVVTVRRMD